MRFKATQQKEKNVKNEDAFLKHFKIISLFFVLFAILILFQLFRWQVLEQGKFRAIADIQYTGQQRSSTGRGIIYGANGSVLAIDEPSWSVFATLGTDSRERELFFEHKDKFVAEVAGILEIEKDNLSSKIHDDFHYFLIASRISNDKKKALEESTIFGQGYTGFALHFEKDEKRLYPDGNLASHVLGFIGKNEEGEDVGLYGIEGYYFGDITGEETYSYEEKDAQGNIILTVEYEPLVSRSGKDIVLTIEPAIQAKVEKELKDGIHWARAKSGTAIVMDPATGAILAMANYPDFNPNEYWRTTQPEVFRNKAVSDVYEYGSVHKAITIAIALDEKKVDTDYICHDNTGFIQVEKERIYTWNKKAEGKLDLSGILEKSNNPCATRVALETGLQTYYPKLSEFGIGQFIGIGLEDESNSYLKPYEEWTELDLAASSFGQQISATPLQIISAMSTIANKGIRMRPHIVSAIIEGDDKIEYKPTKLAQPISKETAETVTKYLENVVKEGEARLLFNNLLSEYDIAGKTGTGQIPKPDRVGYYWDRTNTTFVGYAPAENPKMIMLVKVEQPKIDTYAATTAVPIWVEIFLEIADDLEIPKNK
jgi:cell division protein FtsI/penicillin-binding protein 2